MKKFYLMLVALITLTTAHAKIWRVNNNAGANANFTSAQAANDAAAVLPGDTIHLEPSLTSYGNLSPNKRLTWISTGAFLDVNPNQQFSLNIGKIGNITLTGAASNNSVFHVYVDGDLRIDAVNIRFERCYVDGFLSLQNAGPNIGSSLVVINSWIRGGVFTNMGTNNVVTNNIIGGSINSSTNNLLTVYTHNVINAITPTVGTVNNAIVENNIFNKTTAAYSFPGSTVQFNMSGAANVLPAGNNNQNAILMANVFVNSSGTDDASFVLKAGSPAIGAGNGAPAVNLGAYGGASPFKLALQPAIPAIYKIQAPAAPAGNTLNVTFSTKSNN